MKIPCFLRDGDLSFPGHSREMIKQNKDGAYVMDLTGEKSKATGSMFGFLYGKIYPSLLKEMGEFQTKENIEKLDATLKEKFGTCRLTKVFELRRKLNNKKPFVKATEEIKPKPKREYTVDEMSQYWDALRQFAADFFGMTLEEPDPNWRKHWKPETNDTK